VAISHKRDTNARKPRAVTVAAPIALAATLSVVTLGVLAGAPDQRSPSPDPTLSAVSGLSAVTQQRDPLVTRSQGRQEDALSAPVIEQAADNVMSKAAIRKAVRNATEYRWTTTELNLWSSPKEAARKLGELDRGKKVLITGRTMWGRTEVVVTGTSRWITSGYLSKEEPPTLGGACANGTSVPSGVSPSIYAIHQAVCANFPEITRYGTFGGSGDHGTGRAVDIMVSGARGWEIANFLRENYSVLGISYIIYSQQIWSVERGGEGWRGMSNRGSVTANHYDHVHVSVF
jgi:hypothetical protein